MKLLRSPGRGTDLWVLIQGCISGDLDAVRALIARDPSLARAHYTYRKPLYFAVRENRVDIAQLLAKFGQHEMVALLLERGAPRSLSDDPSWATPLAWARKRGHDEIARLLQR